MKTKISILLLVVCTVFSSCKGFLEEPEDVAGMTPDVVFSTIEDAEKVLAAACSMPPWGFPTLQGGGPWSYGILNYFAPVAALSDEADVGTTSEAFLHGRYHEGQLSPSEIYPWTEDKWVMNWQAIRSGWMFYDKVDKVNDGTSRDYINRRKCEALGMIATKYFEMFKRYGGIPWINRYLAVGDVSPQNRLTIEQTVDSLCNLIDRAMEFLPERNGVGEFGRVNKMAMRVLKARTLLWAASPLFNPENNQSYYPVFGVQNVIKYDSYDKERWKKAADAAKAALDAAIANGYELYDDPSKTPAENYKAAVTEFPLISNSGGTNVAGNNKEIIWGTRLYRSYTDGQGGTRCKIFSRSVMGAGGVPYCIPLQNFVDLYELKDGSVQPADFYNQAEPYSQLDARFGVTIFYHGKQVGSRKFDFTVGGDNDAEGQGQNASGYYLAKFFNERWEVGLDSNPGEAYWPYMRLSEVYLMYAEALMEYDYNTNKTEVLKAINLIRKRAGQPNLEDCPGFQDNVTYVRKRLRNERSIELAYEEQRYFDLKRWKEGDKLAGEMYRMRITGTASDPIFTKTKFETRVFPEKFYLYHIPESEVLTCEDLLQNPGW